MLIPEKMLSTFSSFDLKKFFWLGTMNFIDGVWQGRAP